MRGTLGAAIAMWTLACGGGGDDGDDPPPPPDATLTLHAPGAALAATRGDDEEVWQTVTLDAAGDATVEVHARYLVAVVCDGATFTYRTVQLAGDSALDLTCASSAAPPVDILLDANPDVEIAIGTARGFGGDSVQVPAGVHDIVAIDRTVDPPRFAVQRDVELAANATLPVVVDAGAATLGAMTVNVSFDPTDNQERFLELTTANGTVVRLAASFGGPVPAIPRAALAAGDRVVVGAVGTSFAGVRRTVTRELAADQAEVALVLPEAVGEVTPAWDGAAPTAGWDEEEPFDELRFEVHSADFTVRWETEVRASFASTGGAIQPVAIPDPTAIPGWDAARSVADPSDFEWSFTGVQQPATDTAQTSSRNGAF
jgi:hypothetical protein